MPSALPMPATSLLLKEGFLVGLAQLGGRGGIPGLDSVLEPTLLIDTTVFKVHCMGKK